MSDNQEYKNPLEENQKKQQENDKDLVSTEIMPEGLIKRRILQMMRISGRADGANVFEWLKEKGTSEHVTMYLNNLEADDQRHYNLNKFRLIGNYILLILGIVLFLSLIVFLTIFLAKENPGLFKEVVLPVLALLGGLITGGFGGYGMGYKKGKEES